MWLNCSSTHGCDPAQLAPAPLLGEWNCPANFMDLLANNAPWCSSSRACAGERERLGLMLQCYKVPNGCGVQHRHSSFVKNMDPQDSAQGSTGKNRLS